MFLTGKQCTIELATFENLKLFRRIREYIIITVVLSLVLAYT